MTVSITLMAFGSAMIAFTPAMKFLVAIPGAATLVVAITVLSLSHAVSVAVGVILIPLIFPAAVRSTGLAFTYSRGVAIFGGAATYVVTWLVGVTGNPFAQLLRNVGERCDADRH